MSSSYGTSCEPNNNEGEATPHSGSKAHWDTKAKECFIRLYAEQVRCKNKRGTHLNKVGWAHVISQFCEETGKAYKKLQFIDQWQELREEWQLWCNLVLNEPGLGRDPNTGAVVASDEWWDFKLECYPDAAKFRHRPIEFEDAMRLLFQDYTATGEYAYTPSSGVLPEAFKKRCADDGPSRKGRVPKKANAATRLALALDKIVDCCDTSRYSSVKCIAPAIPTLETCFAKLSSMPEFAQDNEKWVRAASLFMSSVHRVFFMACPDDEKRYFWILKEMEKAANEKKMRVNTTHGNT